MRVGERREPSTPTLLSMCAQTAEEAYAAAANPEIAGQVLSTSNQYGLQEGSREAILEEIFEQCDDDKSGSLDLAEFGCVFREYLVTKDSSEHVVPSHTAQTCQVAPASAAT